MTRGLFITGTNTEVGKTRVTCRIAQAVLATGRSVGVYKPAASGCIREDGQLVSEDAVALWEAAGRPRQLADVCPQTFEAPLAPHLAARVEGREIDEELLRDGLERWNDFELMLVEGAGGLMSPLGDGYVAGLAEEFGFPLVVVVPNVLGAINQTLQTVITAAAYGEGLPVAGLVLNHIHENGDQSTATNRAELEERCLSPILTELGWEAASFATEVDWVELATTECER